MAKRKRTSRTDPSLRKPEAIRRAKIIGDRLRLRRLELKKSQSEVAIALGWQPSRLWEYEVGLAAPRTDALTALCEALEISKDKILAGIDGEGRN